MHEEISAEKQEQLQEREEKSSAWSNFMKDLDRQREEEVRTELEKKAKEEEVKEKERKRLEKVRKCEEAQKRILKDRERKMESMNK